MDVVIRYNRLISVGVKVATTDEIDLELEERLLIHPLQLSTWQLVMMSQSATFLETATKIVDLVKVVADGNEELALSILEKATVESWRQKGFSEVTAVAFQQIRKKPTAWYLVKQSRAELSANTFTELMEVSKVGSSSFLGGGLSRPEGGAGKGTEKE